MLLHIGALHLDVDSHRKTPWQQLAPKTRILCVVLLVFAIALTPNGRWLTWAVYGVGVGAIVLLSRVTLGVLVRRVAVEAVFLSLVLLGTLFRGGGETLWQWGWLRITTEGVVVLGSVTLKALLSLLLMNLLILTTAIPALLHGLVALRFPPLLVAILAAMYRYIAVLIEEFDSMRRAALSRNLMNHRNWQRLVIGNMIGALFIRTIDRGERVHQAMLSRGFEGLPPIAEVPRGGRRDAIVLTLIFMLTLAGQVIYLI
ncbi:MAG TPA: cobalt ECF transporter T component CbiQ [Thermosynechococcaceae cyanobacterium]